MKCQCEHEGVLNPGMEQFYNEETELPFVKHEPGQCQCTNDLKPFMRGGKRVILCSCCRLGSDEEIRNENQTT